MNGIILNNGVEMPQVGLGTFLIPKEKLSKTIGMAYRMGYRQFDTAWRYHNEVDICHALKENGIKREDVFITTKVNADALYKKDYQYGLHRFFNVRNSKSVHDVIMESFDNLGTDYVDLFLIHWPWPIARQMWKELCALYKEGRIRAIGVSNFLQPHIEALMEDSDVVPAVNQFEISPLNANKELISYCQAHGIAVEAMSTFSHFRSVEPRKEILESEVIKPIALKHHKTIAQVVLRWLVQQNIIIIPKTWEEQHLKENISLFDFSLSEEEIKIIDGMDTGRYLNYNPLCAQEGLSRKYRNWEGFKKWNQYHQPHGIRKLLSDIIGI